MRLIDADLFKKSLEDEADSHGYDERDSYDIGVYHTYMNVIELLDEQPSAQLEIIRCKDCRWGRKVCGNIECFVDSNIPPEYHGYEWFCPNGERRN